MQAQFLTSGVPTGPENVLGAALMSKLHFVFGGRVKDPRGLDFDLDTVEMVGLYPDYATALDAWRGKAQRTVDDAEMKYVVVHLHRLLQPEAMKPDA
jgi:hypothetical protein